MKNVSVPLYQKMSMKIIHDIETGTLKANDKLPSEQDLGKIFGISRITVRKALEELQERHFIYKKHGQGSFVLSRKERNRHYQYVDFAAMIHEMGGQAHSKINDFRIVATRKLARIKKSMQLKPSDYLYDICKTYLADKMRLAYSRFFVNYSRFPEITIDELEHEDLLPLLYGKYNLEPDHIEMVPEASILTKEDRRLLDTEAGSRNTKVVLKVKIFEKKKLVIWGRYEIVGWLPMYLQSLTKKNRRN